MAYLQMPRLAERRTSADALCSCDQAADRRRYRFGL